MEHWKFKYYNDEDNAIDWDGLDNLDWISDMKGVQQNPIYHAEGDVYNHTKMVLNELLINREFLKLIPTDRHILVTAALMHDIEKRSTTVIESDGSITSKGHAVKGAKTANQILYVDFKVPFPIRYTITQLIKYHSKPLWWEESNDPNYYVNVLSLKVLNKFLVILATADILGRQCNDIKELLLKIELYKELCISNDVYNLPKLFNSELSRFHYVNNGGYDKIDVFDDRKSEVILMVGVAGSGKSSYALAKYNQDDFQIISLDGIRQEMKIKPTDKKANGKVIQEAKEQARVLLRKGEDFIWDATNLTKQNRKVLIDLFLTYKAYVTIVYVEVPYTVLIERNSERVASVPQKVIDKMISKLEIPEFTEVHNIKFKV